MDSEGFARRALLAKATVVSSMLAGCGSNNEATPTGSTESPEEETETATKTATDTPAEPTLESFQYPDGAQKGGISGSTLHETHRNTIMDAGSATVELDKTSDHGDFIDSLTQSNRYSSEGILQTEDQEDITERRWSAPAEAPTYVQMDSEFGTRYRIDNQGLRPNQVLQFETLRLLAFGAQWSSAEKVKQTENGNYAVVYESTSVVSESMLLQVTHGQSVSEFTASMTVSEQGYVRRLSYDMTVETDRGSVQAKSTITTSGVDETTAGEPSWLDTAKEDGVRFTAKTTEDGKFVKMDMRNGSDVAASTRADLSANGHAYGEIGTVVSEGDALYLGISSSGELLSEVNSKPSGGTDLGNFVYVNLVDGEFDLFEGDVR